MKIMKKMVVLLAWVVLFTGPDIHAAGQGKGETNTKAEKKLEAEKAVIDSPTADQIIEKYIRSLGGKPAIEKLKTELQTGTFEGNGGNMPVEIAIKAPNKWKFEIKFPDGNSFRQLSNGEKGWKVDPQQGVEEMTRDHMLLTSRFLDLQGPIHFKETYTKLEVKGTDKQAGKDCYRIEATPKEGKPQTLFFDVATGFLLRLDFIVETNQGTFSAGMDFGDYKEVDGVKVPFTLHQDGTEEWTITFTDIKRDIPLDNKQFEKPE